jgi:hypothetical protein
LKLIINITTRLEIDRINTYNSSPDASFEAMSIQLFQKWLYRTIPSHIKYFSVVNGKGGDGGVEAYAELHDGTFIGLQAKWHTSSLKSGQFAQITKSLKTARHLRPSLTRYIISIPRKLQSIRVEDKDKVTLNPEDKKMRSFLEQSNLKYENLEVECWAADRLLLELGEPGNEGVKRFWYDKEELSQDLLQTRFELARNSWLKERYTPALDGPGRISELIADQLFTADFRLNEINKLKQVVEEVKTAINLIDSFNACYDDRELIDRLEKVKTDIFPYLEVLEYLISTINQGQLPSISNELVAPFCWGEYMVLNSGKFPNTLKNLVPKLTAAILRIHQTRLEEYVDDVVNHLAVHNYTVLGPIGSGKTHGVARAVDKQLKLKNPALIIRAKDTPDHSWSAIFHHILGGFSTWNDEEIFSALQAMALRRSIKAVRETKSGEMLPASVKVLIIIDGIDEAPSAVKWRLRIMECDLWTKKFPMLRFMFTARSYPPTNMNPCDLPDDDKINRRIDLPLSGDTSVGGLVTSYLDHYNIAYHDASWLHYAFENALTLKLFCEEHHDTDVSNISKNPVNFTLSYLLSTKITRVENSFKEKFHPQLSPYNQTVKRVLAAFVEYDLGAGIEHFALINFLHDQLMGIIDKQQISNLLEILVDHAFLFRKTPEMDDMIEPGIISYEFAYQGYAEYFLALKIVRLINAKEQSSKTADLIRKQNHEVLLLVAIMMIYDHNLLITTLPQYFTNVNAAELQRLEFEALGYLPDGQLINHLQRISAAFTMSQENRDLILTRFVLPNIHRERLQLAKVIIHDNLIRFKNCHERDLFWSGPDYHDQNSGTSITNFLDHIYLFSLTTDIGLPLLLAWSLTSVDAIYRAKCRQRLTYWATENIDGFLEILNLLFYVGEPQIKEDLAIVMMGIAVSVHEKNQTINKLSQWILENIFEESRISHNLNSVVRYAGRSVIERTVSLGELSKNSLIAARPPYNTTKEQLPLIFRKKNNTYPIVKDLDWYVIHYAYDDFVEGGKLKSPVQKFMKPYEEVYSKKITGHNFAVAAALAFLNQLGWHKTSGREWTQESHGSVSDWMTYEEKYTWLAVHEIQGFLADRLPSVASGKLIKNYSHLLSVNNPIQSDIGDRHPYWLGEGDRWYVPEDIAPKITLDGLSLSQAIKKWATSIFTPDFKLWTSLSNLNWHAKHPSRDKWITLYNESAFLEPSGYGRTWLRMICCLVQIEEFEAVSQFVTNNIGRLSGHDLDPHGLRTNVKGSTNQSVKDVVCMAWIEEYDDTKFIINNKRKGYAIKSTICQVTESSPGEVTKYYNIPSKAIRNGLKINRTDKQGFFNSKGEILAIHHETWLNTNESQLLTVVDRTSFEKYCKRKKMVPIWVAEYFRSTTDHQDVKKQNAHSQHCKKWFIADPEKPVLLEEGEHCS